MMMLVLLAVIGLAAAVVAADEVTYRGEFLGARVAAGGETSGWAMRYRTPDGVKTIELAMKPELARQFKPGAKVRVTGTLTEREYVERGKVQVLVVSEMVADDGAQ
jgi:hypothetical protein